VEEDIVNNGVSTCG